MALTWEQQGIGVRQDVGPRPNTSCRAPQVQTLEPRLRLQKASHGNTSRQQAIKLNFVGTLSPCQGWVHQDVSGWCLL